MHLHACTCMPDVKNRCVNWIDEQGDDEDPVEPPPNGLVGKVVEVVGGVVRLSSGHCFRNPPRGPSRKRYVVVLCCRFVSDLCSV